VIDFLLALAAPGFDVALDNVALRQQLGVFKQKRPRPFLKRADRLFWAGIAGLRHAALELVVVVKPETVVGWHRLGWRALWRWKSKPRGRPPKDKEIRDLIRKIANDNPCWGAPKVHSEMLKLGYQVSERTVSRTMPKRPKDPDAIKRWKTFLKNHRHCLAGMDFFVVPTILFRNLYVLFIISHERRRVVHFGVTFHPTAEWIIAQLREAFPFDTAPRYLIYDRDAKFRGRVTRVIKNMGIKPKLISYRSPWQNGVAERWVGSVRRELLDHVVVFGAGHMQHLLRDYVSYYHDDRCHLALGKDAPEPRPVQQRPSPTAKVIALPRVGGGHHRYEWRDDDRAAA
jgi:putative transposase